MTTIELIVSPDGSSRVETHGFVGSQCQQASRFLELALGQKKSEQLKKTRTSSSTSTVKLIILGFSAARSEDPSADLLHL